VAIHLSGLPGGGVPEGTPDGQSDPLCNLAPGGVYRADRVTPAAGALLPHRFTLTCAPPGGSAIGGLFSVALSCRSPRLAVSQHPALWSPDLPRPIPDGGLPPPGRAATTQPAHRRLHGPTNLLLARHRPGAEVGCLAIIGTDRSQWGSNLAPCHLVHNGPGPGRTPRIRTPCRSATSTSGSTVPSRAPSAVRCGYRGKSGRST